MSGRRGLSSYARCWAETLWLSRFPAVLLPFFCLGLLLIVPLLLCRYFADPPASFFMVPALRLLFGDDALHYPQHFGFLTDTVRLLYAPVMIAGFVLVTWSVFMMVDAFNGRRVHPFRHDYIWYVIPQLLLVGFVFAVLDHIIPVASSMLGASKSQPVRLVGPVLILCAILAKALLIYTVVFLKIFQESAATALTRSVRRARRRPRITIAIVVTAAALSEVPYFLTERYAANTTPDGSTAFAILFFGIGMHLFALFFLFASTTFVAVGGRRGQD